MKTISVKEAAQALGITPRAVIYRIQNGDLNGHQTPNPYGVNEWRIYPTKEIGQKLKLGKESESQEIDFAPEEETIDAESVSEETVSEAPQYQAWVEAERQQMRIMAEEMIKPLLDTIRHQERLLDDQERQLKLLPDFEKQAEAERKAAELKALEAEALRKQIEALQVEQEEAEKAKLQVALLEQSLEEAQRQSEAELQKLKEEKEGQLKEVEEQLKALIQTVEDLKQPWWKKWFSAGAEAQ
jgi:nucleoporin GLE1